MIKKGVNRAEGKMIKKKSLETVPLRGILL
jgi:hypothetical protein